MRHRRGYLSPGTLTKGDRYGARTAGNPRPPGAIPTQPLRKQSDPGWSGRVADPFDWRTIVAAPASGTTTVLIGNIANTQGTQPARTVPPGCRGVVYAIAPYAELAGGAAITPGRIPGLGVVLEWKIFVQNRPLGDYGSITDILQPWDEITDKPILEIPEGYTLQATVKNTDPNGLYAFLGLRIRGRFIPWNGDEAKIG